MRSRAVLLVSLLASFYLSACGDGAVSDASAAANGVDTGATD